MTLIKLQYLTIPFIQHHDSGIYNQEVEFDTEQYYHIQAASGRGKSTFLRTLYGLQKNYYGQLFIENINANTFSSDQWAELRSNKLSIVFQDLKLLESEPAFDSINLKRCLTDYYPIEIVYEFASRLNIESLLDHQIRTLSYGERQRVAIIRSLVQDFKCLLLDEPFSHLDEKNCLLAATLIHDEVRKRNATLILTDLENDDRFPYTKKFML